MEEGDCLLTAYYRLGASVVEQADETLDVVEEAEAVCYADKDLRRKRIR